MPNEPKPADNGRASQPTTSPTPKSSNGTTTPSRPAGSGWIPPQNSPARSSVSPGAAGARSGGAALGGPAVGSPSRITVQAVRTRLGDLIWLVALIGAAALSLGALLIALGANDDNVLVSSVLDLARVLDGPFWKVFEFYEQNKDGTRGAPDEVKNHLVNWGLAAVGYLVVGRIAHRVVRP